eukprot:2053952-Rhodomonas_salina.1
MNSSAFEVFAVKQAYLKGVAEVAGVSISQCSVKSVSEKTGSSRSLLAQVIDVVTEVATFDQ